MSLPSDGRLIGRLQALPGRSATSIFAQLDQRGEGGLDGDELAVGLLSMGVPFSREELEDAIRIIDRDSSGEVSSPYTN